MRSYGILYRELLVCYSNGCCQVLLPKFQKAEMSHGAIKSHIVCRVEWISTNTLKQSPGRGCSPRLLSEQFSYIITKLPLWCLHGTRWFTYAGVFNSKCTNTKSDRRDTCLFLMIGNSRLWFLNIVCRFCANSNLFAGEDKVWFETIVAYLPTVSS